MGDTPGARPACSSASTMNASYQPATSVLLVRRWPAAAGRRPRRAPPARRARRAACAGRPRPPCRRPRPSARRRPATAGSAPLAPSTISSRSTSASTSVVTASSDIGSRYAGWSPNVRGPHRRAEHVALLVDHDREPARHALRPRHAGLELLSDAVGDPRHHRAEHRLLGEPGTCYVEEVGRVVEEARLHARTLRHHPKSRRAPTRHRVCGYPPPGATPNMRSVHP